jgi:hypothetical protein
MSNGNRRWGIIRPSDLPFKKAVLFMDVKTQALDRVLEALSPALAAEMDRLVQQTRDELERQFQGRLQAAVRDAENAAASAARAELQRAVEETKETTRRDVTATLEREFAERLEAATTPLKNQAAQLENEAAETKDRLSAEVKKLEGETDRWRTFAQSQQEFGEAASQPEMLARFLSVSQQFAQGLAVYVTKSDGLSLWKSRGNGAFPQLVSRETTDPESYFRIISVRGKTVGAVCATPAFDLEALEFLCGSLERAIESFGLRLRPAAPKQAV